MNYEEAITELEKIAETLENDDVKLDEAVKLFEKSVELSKLCFEKLQQTEGKITVLKKELDQYTEIPLAD